MQQRPVRVDVCKPLYVLPDSWEFTWLRTCYGHSRSALLLSTAPTFAYFTDFTREFDISLLSQKGSLFLALSNPVKGHLRRIANIFGRLHVPDFTQSKFSLLPARPSHLTWCAMHFDCISTFCQSVLIVAKWKLLCATRLSRMREKRLYIWESESCGFFRCL